MNEKEIGIETKAKFSSTFDQQLLVSKLTEFFTDKQNIEIKRELLSTIHTKTTEVKDMSEEKLDKTVKIIRYTLQLYDLSADMNTKIKNFHRILKS